ncbi:class I SAM-dependent methyltransferase [Haloarcula litorea]|uniref:class I SAM-dependent methyltransferase n=1 Tax=Haloarcula litorea TaxID=3032579 RepID=UPI0023E7FEF1|nr:class I SAM-dependent methyltransferase [Halomicroarcula sp. GDY20]
MDHADTRYLDAKRTVDDRALDRRVRDAVLARLPDAPAVVEFAPGTGATVPRLLDWGVTGGTYRGVERDPELVAHGREARADELAADGYRVERTDDGFRAGADPGLDVSFTVGDALAVDEGAADLLVAQAFADLVPPDDLLAAVDRALAPGGLAYLPITFDGATLFQPDHPADERVERAYHDSIAAVEGRDPYAGRHLLSRLGDGDGDLLAVGASDWVVRPRDGAYPADERYFLETILGFVAESLADASVEGAEDWLATRRAQLADAELTYVAHQYDLLCRV